MSMIFAAAHLDAGRAYDVVSRNNRFSYATDAIVRNFPDVEIGYTEVE